MPESKLDTTKQAPEPAPTTTEVPVANTADLDAISLKQALLDFDVANARVIDLTKRLTTLNKELLKTTTALQKAQMRNRRLQSELDELKASTAYRSAAAAARVVRGARSRLGR